MAQRPQPSLRFADGGSFITRWAQNVMRPNNTANRLRQAEAPPPAPTPPPPPPPPNPNATPDNPAGIRFQDGGVVPGTGRGDKIPAKYEPGEFVVSNDMIDDNPGLREQLASMRAETLAARGKTVEEADAKALRYHGGLRGGEHGHDQGAGEGPAGRLEGRASAMGGMGGQDRVPGGARLHHPPQVSLRADDGFGPLGRMAKDLTGQNSLPPKSPVGNMADDLARNARAAPPVPPPGPANPGMANPQAQAAYDDMARAKAQPTAPTAKPAAPAATSAAKPTLRAGLAAESSAVGKGAYAGGRLAGAVAKTVGPAGIGLDVVSHFNDYKIDDPSVDSSAAGTWNALKQGDFGGAWRSASKGALETAMDLGSAAANTLDYVVPGKSPVSTAYDKALRDHFGSQLEGATGRLAAEGEPADTPRKTAPGAAPADDRNPYAAANAAKIAAADAQNKAAPPAAAPPAAAPAAPPGYTNDVTRNGNSYEGTNVRGDITINGFAPGAGLNLGSGPNAQNMAAGDALAGRDTLRSQGAALGGQPAGGSGIPAMAPTLHSGNSWEARNNLRNLEVSASSIYNSRSHWGNKAKAAADAAAFQNAQAMDTAARTGSDPGSVARTNAQASMFGSKTAADASRYGSDNSLRGTMYTADATLGAKRMEMQQKLQQQQLMGGIYQAAGGDPVKAAKLAASYGLDGKSFQDMAAADQTRGFNASKNASSRLESLAVTRNDKGEEVVSPGRLARVNSMVTKMAPNFSQMDEESQTKALRQVEAGVNLLEGINDRRNNGFLQMIGWDGDSPSLDNLPDMKGGKLKTVGALEGATTGGGVARKDYVIEVGGHKLYLPRGKINQGELELLKARGVDISGIDK